MASAISGIKTFWISPYQLMPRARLGAHSAQRPREGSLLKVEFENGRVGYCDVHPWTELGDQSLREQIQLLGKGQTTNLTARSLALAKLDADSRASKKSFFEGLAVPDSHYLFTDISQVSEASVQEIVSQGFVVAKVKVGAVLEVERKALESCAGLIQFRLDFNSVTKPSAVGEWLLSLSDTLRGAIEFCEDPCPWDEKVWADLQTKTGVSFVRDHGSDTLFSTDAGNLSAVSGLIVKPANQNPELLKNRKLKVYVTSYLDHPIGQMGAALEAARLNQRLDVEMCGLLSHSAYEQNAYSEAFPSRGPRLIPNVDECGVGFTSLLENEKWEKL
jgi:o-succinylbenzoate synthase